PAHTATLSLPLHDALPICEFYYRVVVFMQVLVGLAVVTGVWLLLRGSGTTPGHLLYAFLNGLLALVRIGWHARIEQTGHKGMLWLALLALTAVALAARSAVTAHLTV